jgi:hypothetical protein
MSERERPFANNELPPYWQYDPTVVGARLAVTDQQEIGERCQLPFQNFVFQMQSISY